MPLQSKLFAGDAKLNACLVEDSAHVTPGTRGAHVTKLHTALFLTDNVSVSPTDLHTQVYGPSTAAAVLAYKSKRNIINPAYQSKPDNIVGKRTIAALDDDVRRAEQRSIAMLTPHRGSIR